MDVKSHSLKAAIFGIAFLTTCDFLMLLLQGTNPLTPTFFKGEMFEITYLTTDLKNASASGASPPTPIKMTFLLTLRFPRGRGYGMF